MGHNHASEMLLINKNLCTNLINERLGSPWAQEEDGPSQGVLVAVQLLRFHGGEKVGKHSADVPVHFL